MEPAQAPPRQSPVAELVVQNGRGEGSRQPLQTPFTLLGSAACCDIRLTDEGVYPLHCLIVHGDTGFVVRDLETAPGTHVNGERIVEHPLQDGDILTVGEFQARLRILVPELRIAAFESHSDNSYASLTFQPRTASRHAQATPEIEAQRDALRVQVAAVAAQQAALLAEESRLQQQQGALTQQQEQLASHLEDKRRSVVELADKTQAARAALKNERHDRARALAAQAEDLIKARADLEEQQSRLQAGRQRAKLLRRRLKLHFQRLLAVERQQIRQREAAVANQERHIQTAAEKLQQEREAVNRARLSINGDVELGKRQLQDEWQKLREHQRQLNEQHDRKQADLAARALVLRQREGALADAERVFGDAQHDGELKRKIAEQEIVGLESRIVNQRRKLNEQQREFEEVETRLQKLAGGVKWEAEGNAQDRATELPMRPGDSLSPTDSRGPLSPLEDNAAAELTKLADDLADHRLELVEQWQRLALAQRDWEKSRNEAADNLEAMARSFPAREQALLAGEASLAASEAALGQRQQEMLQFRQHLEGWGARVRLRETNWENERDRLLADLRAREAAAEKHLEALVELRQNWAQRRRQELDVLNAERAACEKLRQECATLRQQSMKRSLALEQQQRELSEKTLALEEYQQRVVLRSQDAAGVESRLQRIRNRWLQHNAMVMRATAEQFEKMQTESARLQQRGNELFKVSEELTRREADLGKRQSALEETLALAQAQQTRFQQQLESSQAQRECSKHQIAELQAEVERLARVLLDTVDDRAVGVSRAA